MAKRRITLTSQEMNDINKQTTTLQSQLSLSNARVDELENDLVVIKKLLNNKTKTKNASKLTAALQELVEKAINPPVKVKIDAAMNN